jgi:hypothetical protein
MNLAHRADDLTVVIVSIQVVRGLEAEDPSGFNLRGDVTENVARILVVDGTMRVPLWGSIHWTGPTTFASAVSRIVFNN